MEFFTVFIFAHLMGDFVLQTNKIAVMKEQGVKGLIIHAVVITAVQAALLSIYGIAGSFLGVIVGVIHFGVDYMKTVFWKGRFKKQIFNFIADQGIHVIIIALFSYLYFRYGTNTAGSAYLSGLVDLYAKIGIGLILCTFVGTVTAKIILRDLFAEIAERAFFEKLERQIDAATCMLMVAVVYLTPVGVGILLVTLDLVMYDIVQSRLYRYGTGIILIKFALYVALGAGVAKLAGI